MENKVEHQSPTGEYRYTDYSSKMPDAIFKYDKDYYPMDSEVPDPQVNPILDGARVPIQKVGIAPVDLPIVVLRRDGQSQTLQAKASLYCSLDDPDIKGLNLSRLYLLMHDTIKDKISIEGIRAALENMATKQGSENAYCKLRFRYPWTQKALRSRMPLTHEELEQGLYQELPDGEKISLRKMEGHIAYDVVIEGRYHKNKPEQYEFYLTVDYTYSSTCPCSTELSYVARKTRGIMATPHAQRSIMTTTVKFDANNPVWIEDIIELHREYIPTECQVVVKRRDEMGFAELNGSNTLFSESSVRLMYQGLDTWYDAKRIQDFTISTRHLEALHVWDAIAVAWKHKDMQS